MRIEMCGGPIDGQVMDIPAEQTMLIFPRRLQYEDVVIFEEHIYRMTDRTNWSATIFDYEGLNKVA